MKISKQRFDELSLGCDKAYCEFACECNGYKKYEIADCLDEDRLKTEMSDEEYDAFRHNRLEIAV